MIVSLIFLGISMLVSMVLKNKFQKYAKVPLSNGLTGREVAEKMLRENGIYDVKVTSVDGFLSDHYNPATKTVNLSPDVFNGSSIAAAAVAAHECGHAVQHATAYRWLNLRSKLVPAVQISSTTPNGHAPDAKPYTLDNAHPTAKSSVKMRPRDSSAYITIMKVSTHTP